MKKEIDCLDYVILGICIIMVMILIIVAIYDIVH